MKLKYRNSDFQFYTEDDVVYGVHFKWTPKQPNMGRGLQKVIYTKDGGYFGESVEVRGNHNKSNALIFLKRFLEDTK